MVHHNLLGCSECVEYIAMGIFRLSCVAWKVYGCMKVMWLVACFRCNGAHLRRESRRGSDVQEGKLGCEICDM